MNVYRTLLIIPLLLVLPACALTDSAEKSSEDSHDSASSEVIVEPSKVWPTPVRRTQDCVLLAADQLPGNWPDDFPFYEDSYVQSVNCNANSYSFEVRIRTDDNYTQVYDFYKSSAPDYGWQLDYDNDESSTDGYYNYHVLNYSKPGRNLILDIRHGNMDRTDEKVEIIYREAVY